MTAAQHDPTVSNAMHPANAETIATPTPTAPPPAGATPVLTVEMPDGGTHVVVVDRLPARLGRQKDIEIPIENKFLSRVHLEFHEGPDGVVVRDVSSKNGTLRNGAPMAGGEMGLGDGDTFELGPVRITATLPRAGQTRRPIRPWVWALFAGTLTLGVLAFMLGTRTAPAPRGGDAQPTTTAVGGGIVSAGYGVLEARLQDYRAEADAGLRAAELALEQGRYFQAVDQLAEARAVMVAGREYVAAPEVRAEWERLETSDRARLDAQVEELESMADALDRRQRTVLETYLTRLEDRFASARAGLDEYASLADAFDVLAYFDPQAPMNPADFGADAIAQRRSLRERWAQISGAAWSAPAFAGLCPEGDCGAALALLERRVTLTDADMAGRIQSLAQDWADLQRLQQQVAGGKLDAPLAGLDAWLAVADTVEQARWELDALIVEGASLPRPQLRARLARVLANEQFAGFDFYREASSMRHALDAEEAERVAPWVERINTAIQKNQLVDAYRQLQEAKAEFGEHPDLAGFEKQLSRGWGTLLDRAKIQEQLNPAQAVALYQELYWSTPQDHAIHATAARRLSALGAQP